MPTSEPSSEQMDNRANDVPHSRDKTYVYLWTYKQFQQEQSEWSGVNKALRRHGYRPVQFADPVENKNLSDLVLLDKKAAREIRAALRALLDGSERREALHHEAVQSNNQLKEENQALVSRAANHAQRAAELDGLLGELKQKVQDLEDRYLARAVQQLQHDSLRRCRSLEQRLCAAQQEVKELQKKLLFTVRQEESRRERQSLVLQELFPAGQPAAQPAGKSRPKASMDQRVLDVIDFYESHMGRLGEERRASGLVGPRASGLVGPRASENATEAPQVPPGGEKGCSDATSLGSALQSCQDQLEESRVQQQELRKRVQELTQELKRRPTVKDVKSLKQQLRHMDRLVKHSAPRWMEEEDMPPTGGRHDHHNLTAEIRSILASTQNPLQLRAERQGVDADLPSLLQTLRTWANQISLLKDLHHGLRKLSARLSPWRQAEQQEAVGGTEELLLLVEDLLEDTAPEDHMVLRSPTRHTLQAMLGHFQTLFDVPSLRGVYPAMSRLHARLGEMSNTTRSLCHLLHLDDDAPPSAVVNEVTRVLSESKSSGTQFPSLLTEGDIHSIITRVQEHEEFFSAFHSLVTDLLVTLDVDRLDDIVPVVRELKLQSNSSDPMAWSL